MAVKRSNARAFATLDAKLKELEGVEAKAGWPTVQHYAMTETPVAYVAAIQEFGDGKIPPRPFMRPTVAAKGKSWITLLGQGAKAVINNQAEALQVMDAVAMKAAGDVGKTITEIQAPPLSLLTLMLRKWKREHPGERVTGTIVGEQAAKLKKGPPDLSGMTPTEMKPLVETRFMLQQLTGLAEKVK